MMKLFENWRRFINEESKGRVVDISNMGSGEIPHALARKIEQGIVVPCTSSFDCAQKRKEQAKTDPWPGAAEWTEEQIEYIGGLRQSAEEALALNRDPGSPDYSDFNFQLEEDFHEFIEKIENTESEEEADELLLQYSDDIKAYIQAQRGESLGVVRPSGQPLDDEYIERYLDNRSN